jgi:alanine racemase
LNFAKKMTVSGHKIWVEISRSALRHNLLELRRLVGPDVKLMSVVKSNAYGHGLPQVVRCVDRQADWFGVDSLPEALAVRQAGSKKPVLILGYTPSVWLKEAVQRGFSMTVYDPNTVERLARIASPGRPAKIHLKIETGTSRQGILAEDLVPMARRIRRHPQITVEGLSTHYANIEDTTDPSYAQSQLRRFEEAMRTLAGQKIVPTIRHTACSAAAMLYPETRFDLARTGISMYGLWPSEQTKKCLQTADKKAELRPALSWKTVVAQVKRLPKGTPISYGLTERLAKDSVVAVLPVGYWDGFDRGLSSQGSVLIRGRRAKVLGRVCMNMCVVDVSGIRGVGPEDEVVLLGRQGRDRISAEETAAKIGTINYEVVTRINPALPRIIVK